MDDLKDKVKIALDEARILVLGVQVLVGFEYQSVFQKNFDQLPGLSQNIKVASLLLMLLAFGLIVAPVPYNMIVEDDNENPAYLRFITGIVGVALFPFALGLSGDVYVAVEMVAGAATGMAAAVVALLLALALWYGVEIAARQRDAHDAEDEQPQEEGEAMQEKQEPTPLKDKIQFVLTETRVVLPGSQALLGFQFATMLTDAFGKLPSSMKYLHLVSLFAIAISIVLLMAPAAFHRLADEGRNTRRLHRFATVMVLAAMFFLAAGIAGDLYIVVQMVTESPIFALACSLVTLLFFYGLWFGYSYARRTTASSN